MDETLKWLLATVAAGLGAIGLAIGVGWRYFTTKENEKQALLVKLIEESKEEIKVEREKSDKQRAESDVKADKQRAEFDTKIDLLTREFSATIKEIASSTTASINSMASSIEKLNEPKVVKTKATRSVK